MFSKAVFLFLLVTSSYGNTLKGIKKIVPFISKDGRVVEQTLHLNNPYGNTGDWGIIELCPDSSVIMTAEVKYQQPNNMDETAINAIKFYCQNKKDGGIVSYITSTEGFRGSYRGIKSCSNEGVVTGVRINTLKYQGTFTDDVAIQNVEISCDYGKELIQLLPTDLVKQSHPISPSDSDSLKPNYESDILPSENIEMFAYNTGEWSQYLECNKNLIICGLQIRWEDGSVGDEVAVSDVMFYCCRR